MSDKVMYAIAGIVVLVVLVIVLDVACMMTLDMRLTEVPQRAVAIVAGVGAFQPKPVAAQTLAEAAPVPRASEATPSPIPSTPLPTHTPQPTHTPSPQRPLYRVVEAFSGDTIKVSRAGRTYLICYAGIEAPDPATVIGCMATQANRRFVKAKTVYLEKDTSETDQSGCLVRHVFLEDGTFVSAKLVYFGYAIVRADYPNTRYRDALLKMQRWAKEAKFGLWETGPVFRSLPMPTPTPRPSPTATPLPPPTPTAEPVTATPTSVTPTITPTPTEEFVSGVVIAGIRYETDDEYIEIKNQGTAPQDMTGWKMQSYEYNPEGCEPYEGQVYPFPNGYILNAGASVRIHSGTDAYDSPPSDLVWDRRHIWNDNGDKAILHNADGDVVDTYCYEECCP